MNLKQYLEKISLEKDHPLGYYLDEWINIFERLHIRIDKYPNGTKNISGVYSQLDEEYKINLLDKKVFDYPFDDDIINRILSIQKLYIGNAEIGEIVRISNIEPLRYLSNLEEISICNNSVSSLLPLYGMCKLKRVWIENTMIKVDDRNNFIKCNPNVKLESQVYL